jgi:hypothetical protein
MPDLRYFADLAEFAESGESAGNVVGLGTWDRVTIGGVEVAVQRGSSPDVRPLGIQRLLEDGLYRELVQRQAEERMQLALRQAADREALEAQFADEDRRRDGLA